MPELPANISRSYRPKRKRKPPGANKSFYDSSAWIRTRKLKVQLKPLCEACYHTNELTYVDQVDHIIPIQEGGAKTDMRNLMSLCYECHGRKSALEKDNNFRIATISTPYGLIPENKEDSIKIIKHLNNEEE